MNFQLVFDFWPSHRIERFFGLFDEVSPVSTIEWVSAVCDRGRFIQRVLLHGLFSFGNKREKIRFVMKRKNRENEEFQKKKEGCDKLKGDAEAL